MLRVVLFQLESITKFYPEIFTFKVEMNGQKKRHCRVLKSRKLVKKNLLMHKNSKISSVTFVYYPLQK